MSISDSLDRFIGVISPKAEAKRRYYRAVSLRSSNKYAAAKTNRSTGAWSPTDAGVNDVVEASSAAVRNRVRQLVRDFPYFARALNILVDYTVGEGIVYQSRVKDGSGDLAKKINQQNEDAWNWFADEADISGKLHLYEMMRLAKRQDGESGEFLLVKTRSRDPNRFIPLAYQMYEADWLCNFNQQATSTQNLISQGIEYHNKTGQVVAYHFYNPDSWYRMEAERIPANSVIHGFQTLRPGQLRGISPFAPGVLVARDLSDHMDATLDQAKMASKWLAFVTSPDAMSRQLGVETDAETQQKIEELENGIIEYLSPGEDVKFPSNPHPGDNFDPFVRLILMMFSVVAGAPYELVSGDYRGMNYNTGRTSRNDFAHQLKPVVNRHVRQFCKPVLVDFMNAAVLSGRLPHANYFNNPRPYLAAHWQGPGQASIDPLKETKAHIDQIKASINSPQRICRARGEDFEDVVRELGEAKKMVEGAGLTWGEAVSTSGASNPAAVSGQKGDWMNLDTGEVVNIEDLEADNAAAEAEKK